ncbi:MAG TPA: succinyl-diaminopimelate desuccinylase [Acidimicrobiia bacterium]|nr:succinyl-diaminopimelate desuccinylase [Acidimicrobiia bacterium]
MTALAETLAWLVDIPSPTGDEGRIATEVAARLYPAVGLDGVDRFGNSLIAGHRTDRPLVVVAGHLDTVPSQGQGPARIDGDRLHGLGAADMKSGLAVMIHLLEDAAIAMGPYDVVGVFYAGEEGPSAGNELEEILQSAGWIQEAELAVVMEPSDGEIQFGCNGVINARLSFRGRSAHSARPWLGENAIHKAGALLEAMNNREPLAVEIAGLTFKEVMSITGASGGIANNIIPPTFDLNLNFRFAPHRTLEEAEDFLRAVARGADEIEIVDAAPAGQVDADHVIIDRLADISHAARTAKQGWTDVARFGVRGIRAINYGPGETSQAHQAEESVALSDLEKCFDAVQKVLSE